MFEVIGMIAVWLFVGWLLLCFPVIVGAFISDQRKDDGKAMYLSVPISFLVAGFYAAATIIYFVVT